MKESLEFLRQLADNNNRPWFMAHKDEYKRMKERFDALVTDVIAAIREFDDSIGPLSPADCTWRIYRDVRFSADKRPYKTHLGAFIAPGGKKSGFSGYYFHIAPPGEGWEGGCFLATGNYYCPKEVVATIREDITLDEGKEFKATLDAAEGWELDFDGALKKAPKGMPADAPYSDWLRLRNYCLAKKVDEEFMCRADLPQLLAQNFIGTKPFLHLINRAIDYTREE